MEGIHCRTKKKTVASGYSRETGKVVRSKEGMKVADIQKGDAYNLDFEDNSIELAEDILWTLWTMWTLGVCGHWEFVGFESLVDFVDSVHNVYKKNILTLNMC
jgi:hypothetical protein